MLTRKSRQLVIDASVARASGHGKTAHPTAVNCARFLEAVKRICHQIVMTPEIAAEWKRHRSRFAHDWLRAMDSRKKVHRTSPPGIPAVASKLCRRLSTQREKAILEKDLPLIQASLATDKRIVSLDDTMRRLLTGLSESVHEIGRILWVNPDRADAVPWLENGAPPEKHRLLGSKKDTGLRP